MKTSILGPLWAMLVLLPISAGADVAPPPGADAAYRRDLIRQSGYRCDEPVTLKPTTPEQANHFAEKGLRASLVQCGNGKTYLVATPPPRRPRQPAGPVPEPVVLPVQ